MGHQGSKISRGNKKKSARRPSTSKPGETSFSSQYESGQASGDESTSEHRPPSDVVNPTHVSRSDSVYSSVQYTIQSYGDTDRDSSHNSFTSASGSQAAAEPKLGLEQINYINVPRKDYHGRIELLQGSVGGLAPEDETDLLIVYLRERGQFKANQDSALAALNRAGICLTQLEKETRPQPSYRRHYHCWLTRPLPKPRPVGLEYKRLLVYEDPGQELTRDDALILDIMKCLTTVIGGDVQIKSVLIPLSGALLSPSLRKHFVKATVEVAYSWLQMGLPVREVKILLPPVDIRKEIATFAKVKEQLTEKKYQIQQNITYDVFFSYAEAEKRAAGKMLEYFSVRNPSIRLFDAQHKEISVRRRGVVNLETTEAISQSRIFLALLSDAYFNSVECTEAFSLAYCRDFESQGNFIIPLFWKSCDLTPLARRLVATEGVDCREASFSSALMLLDEIVAAFDCLKAATATHDHDDEALHTSVPDEVVEKNMNLGDKLLMQKELNDDGDIMFEDDEKSDDEEEHPKSKGSELFFDYDWRREWETDFNAIVFGPRIGAGGFGEVYKCKWERKMVAIKTLQKIEDDDPHAVMAEFMVEMKLMSKLRHPNVVAFLGAAINAPKLAIILEFMPGGSLYRAIHRRRRNQLGPFPLLKSAWIAFGICKGMQYLHSQNPTIVHRDLKSPNILLGTNVREVKITDFGLSRLLTGTHVQTGPGGTPEWMAPELLRQDAFDEQSDVYSFGVILWELIMCEKPWKDDHPMQIVFKVGSRGEKLETPPPEVCVPEIRNLINQCFSHDPAARPRSSELTKMLQSICNRNSDTIKAH